MLFFFLSFLAVSFPPCDSDCSKTWDTSWFDYLIQITTTITHNYNTNPYFTTPNFS